MDEYEAGIRLFEVTESFGPFSEMTMIDIGPHLRCSESDALAHVLNLLDLDDLAEALRDGHALGDEAGFDDIEHLARARAIRARYNEGN